ncbi:MAG: hypothetical protein IAE77_04515 [Prosthecobacter sp.]|jgi:hypothetical protein|uniref:hypothetical protein n=1 Tax=Prosthecobacter sp. TaxID=1965333 RepID=UPI001A0285BC|nr:hypothetical protein [Prosthecobacter sp.]MBE2282707.1 hypothetical protein [Prosthecobacter sp.]
MRTAFHFIRLAVQAGSAWVLGVVYYLLAMGLAVYEGFESLIGQPVVGVVLSAAAVAVLLVVGLPLRLIPALHRLWLRVWWVPLLLGVIAIGCSVLSWQPSFRVMLTDPEFDTAVPCFHPALGYGGWLLAIFAALHFYPPLPLDRIADEVSRVGSRVVRLHVRSARQNPAGREALPP